jgi:hypothetical protein
MPSILNATTSSGLVTSADNSGSLQLATNNGTTAVTIDTSQNVGIGTASPAYPLHINSTGLASIGLTGDAASKTDYRLMQGITAVSNGGFSIYDLTNTATRMAITSDGVMQFNSGYGSSANAYGCRAWVNLNNTGTPSIRASGNVSSITDNGTGIFTVNFQTAMPNTNYCVSSWVRSDATSEAVFGYCTAYSNGTKTTSAMQFLQGVQNNGITYNAAESSEIGLTFFR